MMLSACIPEPENPTIELSASSQLAQVRDWFEANKTKLRLPERGTNFRTESQELILPFFEKEPDWEQFHHYFFPDGREVFEVSLENATKYFPASMLDSFPDRDVKELVIQNIMFISHPTEQRFDPVIARYYPDGEGSIEDFEGIYYDGIPHDWSGVVDIWTYDERHFIGFRIENGNVFSYFSSSQNGFQTNSGRILGDCRERYYEVYIPDPFGFGGTLVGFTVYDCTGSGGENPDDDGDFDYQRPPCCDDPTAPPSDIPPYEPPSVPAPSTIINQLTNPCAADIFKELSKGSAYLTDMTGLGSLDIFPGMLDLFENSGQFDYRIRNGMIDSEAGGTTSPIVNGIITITLSDDYLRTATSLSITRTNIHETVHAYLRKQTSYRSATDMNTHQLLVEYGRKYPGIINDAHHSLMSQFILGMAVSLYNWDKKYGPTGGSLGFDYYYKMAFGGLVKNGTRELILEAKPYLPDRVSWDEIRKILENEATGNYQANGEKCD
jgi:hypothetical protein